MEFYIYTPGSTQDVLGSLGGLDVVVKNNNKRMVMTCVSLEEVNWPSSLSKRGNGVENTPRS